MTRILWIHPKAVLGGHGGSELRTRTLLPAVARAGHQILLAQRGVPSGHRQIEGVQPLDLEVRSGVLGYIRNLASHRPMRSPTLRPAAIRAARACIAAFSPEICIVSELASFEVARSLFPPGIPWIYDAHNVDPELFMQLAVTERNLIRRATCRIDVTRFARDQADVLAGAAAVAAVSETDLAILRRQRSNLRATVVPSSVPLQVAAEPQDADPVVLFVGTLDYLPNIEAVDELLTNVMPDVRVTVPNARLVVVGRSADRTMRRRMLATSWCEVHEDVPDLAPFYRRTRCVAIPLVTGSGTRLKTYEAMSYGVPVVGSPLAFEGIAVQDGATAYCTADRTRFRAAVLQLLTDPGVAERIGRRSWEYFNHYLAPSIAAAPLIDLIDDVTAQSHVAVIP